MNTNKIKLTSDNLLGGPEYLRAETISKWGDRVVLCISRNAYKVNQSEFNDILNSCSDTFSVSKGTGDLDFGVTYVIFKNPEDVVMFKLKWKHDIIRSPYDYRDSRR